MINNDKLVSVILLGEDGSDDEVFAAIKNVRDQTHKNIDVVVSLFREGIDDSFKERCSKLFLNIRWFAHTPSTNFLDELIELSDGYILFYKTINNILWMPRHIEAHLDEFNKDNKIKWCLSHVENKNAAQADSPYNTISFRIDNPPDPDTISIDEVCHHKDLKTDWGSCLENIEGAPLFLAGRITKQWIELKSRGSIPPEITIAQWVDINTNQEDEVETDQRKQIGQPSTTEIKEDIIDTDDGEFEITRIFPTVMGNKHHDEYNDNIRQLIHQTENISSIGLKRTIGLGDVVVVEPIIRRLKEKYPETTIDLHTSVPDIVKYFSSQPDNIITTDTNSLLQDTLSETKNQVKFDLDMAYESRENISFIDAYAEVVGIEFNGEEQKKVKLVSDSEPEITEKYVVVCGDGSGWPGKTWGVENYKQVIEYIHSLGYLVVETGAEHTDITPEKYHACEFDIMVNLIANCDFYVGADNGPMHIARGFDRPCVLIAGVARPYYTNPNRDNVVYVENHTSKGLGVKHTQFFNHAPNGITFMPIFEPDPSCGLKDMKPLYVKSAIDKLLAKPLSPVGNEMDYAFNIPGNLVLRDVMPGFAYYKDNVTNIFWREERYYHPEQRIDVSYMYNKDQDIVWKNNYLPIIDYIENNNHNDKKVLDVGCNMGIFVEGYNKRGGDCIGIDINKLAITRGLTKFDSVKDKLILDNYLTHNFSEKFGVIVCNDIINTVSDPVDFLCKVHRELEDDGIVIINFHNYDSEKSQKENRKWEGVGVGEKVTMFGDDAFLNIINQNGFEVVEEYCKDVIEVEDIKFYICKKVG
tara:strand:- start:14228 stop:16657 length:2430 start_codon:yes stop_codon:yes gene_type:complete